MDVISRRKSSALNPNAPLFVPLAYRTVEDFSDRWWDLVRSSAWFRDYWIEECFQEPQNDFDFSAYDEPALLDLEALFDDYSKQEDEEKEYCRDLISLGALKWRRPRVLVETPKYFEKAPKIVNVKVSPRPIQQPR